VNLSARQFQQQDLAKRIEALLDKTGLPADCLDFELTESVLMDNAITTSAMLKPQSLALAGPKEEVNSLSHA